MIRADRFRILAPRPPGRLVARGGIGNTLGSDPRDSRFDPWRANRQKPVKGRRDCAAQAFAVLLAGSELAPDGDRFSVEGWPSGLWRRPAKALGREARVGSNPTPSVSQVKRVWDSRPRRVRARTNPILFCLPDGWLSGLRRTPGKRVGMQVSRGFKSHPVRFAASAACRRVNFASTARPRTCRYGGVAEW